MSGGLPQNLTYFLGRMQGVSTSAFKIYPQNTGSQTANKIIRFELPSNTLLNLKSTRIFFNCVTASNGANSSRMPNDTRSFIDRMAIYMGGVLVQNSFSNYNVLVHAQKALGADRCTDSCLTHQEIPRAISYHNGTAISDHESYTTPDVQLAISDFLGFLGSAEPSIVDTGLFPQITVEITLADNVIIPSIDGTTNDAVLATTSKTGGICATAAGGANYTLTEMTMQVEVLGMASSILDEVVMQRISQVGYLSVPFLNYFSFSSTHNNTTRFNINSASFNKLWVAWRDPANASPQAPQVVAGHKLIGGFTADTSGGAVGGQAAALGKPQYDSGGVYNTNKLTVPEVYALTMNSIDIYDKTRMMTLDQYRKNFFVQAFRFDLPESSYSRVASGLDTRASSAQCAMVTENMTADTTCFLFCECMSELRVANRAIEIII